MCSELNRSKRKMSDHENLDRPLWGAQEIGREAGTFKDDGSVDERRAFYLLERRLVDATKVGRLWTSTPRRVRRSLGIA
jgi:hypothetical protein